MIACIGDVALHGLGRSSTRTSGASREQPAPQPESPELCSARPPSPKKRTHPQPHAELRKSVCKVRDARRAGIVARYAAVDLPSGSAVATEPLPRNGLIRAFVQLCSGKHSRSNRCRPIHWVCLEPLEAVAPGVDGVKIGVSNGRLEKGPVKRMGPYSRVLMSARRGYVGRRTCSFDLLSGMASDVSRSCITSTS